MYRRLVPVWVLLTMLLTVAYTYSPPDRRSAAVRLGSLTHVTAPGWLATSGDMGQAASALMVNLLPLGIGTLLAAAAAFNPGRRPRAWELPLRWLGAAAMAVYAFAWLIGQAQSAAAAATVLASQVDRAPLLVLLASQAAHGVVNSLALGFVLAAPLFWVVRTPQVRSFARASFEAWAEIRRLLVPAVLMLLIGSLIEVFVAPSTTAMVLHP